MAFVLEENAFGSSHFISLYYSMWISNNAAANCDGDDKFKLSFLTISVKVQEVITSQKYLIILGLPLASLERVQIGVPRYLLYTLLPELLFWSSKVLVLSGAYEVLMFPGA